MTTISPNQEGVEGTECEVVWMITVESIILFIYASFVRNPFVLPHQEGIFFCCFATGHLVAQFVGFGYDSSLQVQAAFHPA
jgi:hypothetical protein